MRKLKIICVSMNTTSLLDFYLTAEYDAMAMSNLLSSSSTPEARDNSTQPPYR
jgi:hypothetical protein